jgi:ornithine decarboxylase
MEKDYGTLQFTYLTSLKDNIHDDDLDTNLTCCDDTEGVVHSLTLAPSPQPTDCSDVETSSEDSSSETGHFAPTSFCAIENELSQEVGTDVFDAHDFGSMAAFVDHRVQLGLEPGSFLVTNLAAVVAQYHQWISELPMVEPFYAVKCNPDPAIVRMLASLGCNFDCATMGEIDLVLHGLGEELSFAHHNGKASRSIVYANPAKMEHMLNFAMDHGVRMTVFDGEDELIKIAKLGGHNKLDLLLRLTTDDKASVCRFSKKFGCPVAEAPRLLDIAKSLGLHVAGVSFHVGSGCGDAGAYTTALKDARAVFDYAASIGMRPMSVVDIGGGFPGDSSGYGGDGMPSFQALAQAIRNGIASFKRAGESVRFIAEPGRYFVSASTAIVTRVYSRKGGNSNVQALYVDDGVYGSFNNVVYDHALPVPRRLASYMRQVRSPGAVPEEEMPSAVFGPTCDGLDQMCSLDSTTLPRCEVGDWLLWENQGAYTHTASFVFNGYTHFPNKLHCYM